MRRTLALVLALAAVLLFAPIARADIDGGIDPYRDFVGPQPDRLTFGTADDDMDEDDEIEAEQAGNGEETVEMCHVPPGDSDAAHTIVIGAPAVEYHMDHHDDAYGSCEGQADDGGSPDDGGNDNPGTDDGTNPEQPQGPGASAVAAFPTYWLWLLLLAIVGGAVATALVLRRRRMRTR
jgi:hypothetical protein